MTGRNWDRERDRSRIARQGTESIDGAGVHHGPPARRPPKSELRSEIASAPSTADAMITKIVACKCGRRKTVRIPATRLGARFRCSSCGEVTT